METVKFITPSGFEVELRECNAEEEGLLTNQGFREDNTSIARFLAEVIISEKPIRYEEIMDWKLGDKYYSLIQSRVLNYGPSVAFEYQFEGETIKRPYSENLLDYLLPESDSTPLPPKVPTPYPHGSNTIRELTLSTGKQLKYTYLNSWGEKLVGNKKREDLSYLDMFSSRFLQLNINGEFIKLENYKGLSSKEAREIRADIVKNDPTFDTVTEIPHPEKPSKTEYQPLVLLPNFLVPSEI